MPEVCYRNLLENSGMSEHDHSRFDLEIKALMDSAEEEVPDRVWESLCGRLDEIDAARRPLIPVWIRRTAATVAAAAAVTAAVILLLPRTGDEVSSGDYIAVIPSEQDRTMLLADVPSSNKGNAVQRENLQRETAEKETAEKEDAQREGAQKEEAQTTVTPKEEAVEETSDEAGVRNLADEAAAAPEEGVMAVEGNRMEEAVWPEDEVRTRTKVRTALSISGNAMTNTKSSGSSRTTFSAMRPSIGTGRDDVTMSPITENGSSSYGIPVSFGIGAKFLIGKRWAIGAGLNYTLLTRSFKGIYVDPANPQVSEFPEETKIRNSVSYIGIPINVYFSIINTNRIDFYANAGGSVEKCVANVFRMQDPATTYREKVDGFQYSVAAGLGVEFIVADILGIYAEPSVRYYFKSTTQPKSIRTENPVSFGFEIGLRIRL